MKKWCILAVLLGLVTFTCANSIIDDREGYLKYGWVFCTVFVVMLALIRIIARHGRSARGKTHSVAGRRN